MCPYPAPLPQCKGGTRRMGEQLRRCTPTNQPVDLFVAWLGTQGRRGSPSQGTPILFPYCIAMLTIAAAAPVLCYPSLPPAAHNGGQAPKACPESV